MTPKNCAEAKNLEEFMEFRYNNDIQSVAEFKRKVLGKKFVYRRDPLGCMLQIMNFVGENTTIRDELDREDEEFEKEKWSPIQQEYGLSEKNHASYVQTGSDKAKPLYKEIGEMVKTWVKAQGGTPLWIPAYAPASQITPKVQAYCKSKTPTEILHTFNIFKDDPDTVVELQVGKKFFKKEVLYPFNDWDLARMMQFSYER